MANNNHSRLTLSQNKKLDVRRGKVPILVSEVPKLEF
jgi:hypothetical protein